LRTSNLIQVDFIKHHAMNTYEGVEAKVHEFLILALDKGEWTASPPGRVPGTHCTGWAGHIAGLGTAEKIKIPSTLQ
jgi:hypothetical protein